MALNFPKPQLQGVTQPKVNSVAPAAAPAGAAPSTGAAPIMRPMQQAAAPAQTRFGAPSAQPAPAAQAYKPQIFTGMRDVKPSFGANYVKDGHYVALIRAVKQGLNRSNIPFVAIEMTVLLVLDSAQPAKMSVGEEFSHLMMCNNESFKPNFKQFVCACFGQSPEQVDDEACAAIVSDDNPMYGMFVEFEASTIITKVKKAEFTKVIYKGAVSATELAQHIDPALANRVLGEGTLAQLVQHEAASQG